MSPQPRRRRRRRRGQGRQEQTPADPTQISGAGREQPDEDAPGRTRRRRRGRRGERSPSPVSSEELVRGPRRQRPVSFTGPHDGQTLEGIIGELQSEWGVPENPQEYRITVKVAEDRDGRVAREVVTEEATRGSGGSEVAEPDRRPKRERAPAAPRIGAESTVQPTREKPPSSRRRGRRRRRRSNGSAP